jgi:hypothetical protein
MTFLLPSSFLSLDEPKTQKEKKLKGKSHKKFASICSSPRDTQQQQQQQQQRKLFFFFHPAAAS